MRRSDRSFSRPMAGSTGERGGIQISVLPMHKKVWWVSVELNLKLRPPLRLTLVLISDSDQKPKKDPPPLTVVAVTSRKKSLITEISLPGAGMIDLRCDRG